MAGFSVSDSTNIFRTLNARELRVSENLSVTGNFNNRLVEQTLTLYSPITFNEVLADSYYALNSSKNIEEGGPSGFKLPVKSYITEASVILSDVSWTEEFEDGFYLKDPTKPVTFTMGYQINPEPSKDFNGDLSYDSTGFSFTGENIPGVIFKNSIIRNAEIKNGGGLIVSGGNSNIGSVGTTGNLNITPMWVQLSVPGEPNIGGKRMTNSAQLKITLTIKKVQN